MKNLALFICGIILGGTLMFVGGLNKFQTSKNEETSVTMIRFLVNLEKGQAVEWKNLSVGNYRFVSRVDQNTVLVMQLMPLGDNPMFRDIPEPFIRVAVEKNDIIRKIWPMSKEW